MLIGLDENERPFAKPEVVAAEREAQRLDATDWPAALVEEQEARRIAEQHLEGMHEATERGIWMAVGLTWQKLKPRLRLRLVGRSPRWSSIFVPARRCRRHLTTRHYLRSGIGGSVGTGA